MNIHIEIERLVVHDIDLTPGDRRQLLAAVEHAITECAPGWADSEALGNASVPVLRADPIALPGKDVAGARVASLATGIAAATTTSIAGIRGGPS